VVLRFSDQLAEGLYRFRVIVTADGGWTRDFQAVHFVRKQIPAKS